MKFTKASFALAACALTMGVAVAQDNSDKMNSKSGKMGMNMDSRFAMAAASGGMTEVQLGQMAKDKGSSQAVKNFGQKMVDDHGKANEELKGIAATKNITLPTSPNAKDQATITKMSGLSGAAFDRAYVKDMVMDHKKDIAAFQKESSSGKDNEIKAFATKTLPTLQEHQKMINDIAAKKM